MRNTQRDEITKVLVVNEGNYFDKIYALLTRSYIEKVLSKNSTAMRPRVRSPETIGENLILLIPSL